MYRQHPSHPCPSFMGQGNHHPPLSSIIGLSAEVDLYQLKKPEIISILVSDTGAHIVRALGKMKTTFHLRNRIEVSGN